MTTAAKEVSTTIKASELVVSAGDRIGFAMFMAVILHVTLVLGISFAPEVKSPVPFTVAVTLTQYEDKKAPKDADFIAPTNQLGSGTEKKKAELTTTKKTSVTEVQAQKAAPAKPVTKPQKRKTPPARKVVTTKSLVKPRTRKVETPKPAAKTKKRSKKSLMRNALEIASLEAKLDYQQKNYAKRPRTARLTAVSAKSAASAFYMHNWVQQVERVGNLNYPQEARKRGLDGKVRVAVLIKDNGRLGGIEILESSGYKVLDDAVNRIVRLAAPFGPFTESMLKEADQFEIIRTFSFGRRISSF